MSTMTMTRVETQNKTENSCYHCGWEPENLKLWPTFGGKAVRWIERNLIFAEGDSFGEPVRLRRDQKRFIYRWYEYCPSCDWWRYGEALRGAARGDGKTAFVAMIAVLEFAGPPEIAPYSPNVVVAAASWEQADILYGAAKVMMGGKDQEVEEAPLCGKFEVYDGETTHIDGRPGRLFRTATVAGTNQGGQPTLFMADELHEFGDILDSRAKFHKVVRMGTRKRNLTYRIPQADGGYRKVKRGPGRIINLSTAGEDVDHSYLGKIYKRGLREKHQHKCTRLLFDWRSAPEGLDYKLAAHREIACRAASAAADQIWSVDARVSEWEDNDEITDNEWMRYYANLWVAVAVDSWLKEHPAAWPECEGTWELAGDEPAVLSVDMALTRDSVGVDEVTRLADGRYAVTSRIWYPADNQLPFVEIFEYIENRAGELGTRFRGLVYDPRYFELQAKLLEDAGFLVIQFDQSPVRMIPAVGMTFDLIKSRGIVHDGDPEFTRQVQNAAKRPFERGWTLSKSKSKIRIDSAVAMCMGVWSLAQLLSQPESSVVDQIW
jgi:phage terminase large subunit-like protein